MIMDIFITIYLCLFSFLYAQGEYINFVNGPSVPFNAPFCPPTGLQDSGIRWEDDSGSGVYYTNIADAVHGLSYQHGRDDDFLNLYVPFVNGDPVYPSSTGPIVPILENVTGYNFGNQSIGDGVFDTVLVEVLEQLPSLGTHPGVSIFDFDGDCDLDIFVSNTIGHPNSLFENQLNPANCGGKYTPSPSAAPLTFVDIADSVGPGFNLINHESAGSCFGDIDNDGDNDLIVLGRRGHANYLFINNGSKTFSAPIQFDDNDPLYSNEGCAFGDINADGFLDLLVTAGTEFTNLLYDYSPDIELVDSLSDPNQLYLNVVEDNFGEYFEDITVSAKLDFPIYDKEGCYNDTYNGRSSITHHAVILDVNSDGCQDVIWFDEGVGNWFIPRGNFHIWLHDGPAPCDEPMDGHQVTFTDKPVEGKLGESPEVGLPPKNGSPMGGAWGDINCDGILDFFQSDAGRNIAAINRNEALFPPGSVGDVPVPLTTQWLLGNGDGTFTNPFPPANENLWTNPFGWGVVMYDYDLDGDLDFLTHGGLGSRGNALLDNPGYIWVNQGCNSENETVNGYKGPKFTIDRTTYPQDLTCVDEQGNLLSDHCTPHVRREVRSVAIGDLNNDGRMDIVTTSGTTYSAENFTYLVPGYIGKPGIATGGIEGFWNNNISDILDETSFYARTWQLINKTHHKFLQFPDRGDLFVEIENGTNNNNWVKFEVRGSKNILCNGKINRNGIGTLLTFTPNGLDPVLQVVTGGDSNIAAIATARIFGLGNKNRGDLTIQFPGNLWNAFYKARKNTHYIIYEIPCNYKDLSFTWWRFRKCVNKATSELFHKQLIDWRIRKKMRQSNKRAYCEYRGSCFSMHVCDEEDIWDLSDPEADD